MALTTRATTTTQDKILAELIDSILNSNVLGSRVLRRAKKWSGEKMKKPFKYQKNTNGGSFAGFDTFSTSATDNRVLLSFDPKFYRHTMSLPLDEISVNKVSETQVLDLMELEIESTWQDAADSVGALFYGDGTGNSSKDFLGLEAIVDDGTNAATYGSQSRSTFTTLQSTVTASGGTLTLAKMATLYTNITSGSVKPTLGMTTETVFDLYEQLLQPQERIMKDVSMVKAMKAGTGFTGLHYKGFPIMADEQATSGVLYFVNEDFLDWYALPLATTKPIKFRSQDIKGNDYSDVLGLGFSWSDWIKPSNAAALTGHVYLGGNFVSYNPKRHGKLTGVTSV